MSVYNCSQYDHRSYDLSYCRHFTQEELADKLFVTSKAVSKWEPGQGLPDISLLEPLAKALDISVIELLSGEDEYYITMDHPMTKDHYISFIAGVRDQSMELVKLYPQGPCEARFKIRRLKQIYAYCNRHGLFQLKIHKNNR